MSSFSSPSSSRLLLGAPLLLALSLSWGCARPAPAHEPAAAAPENTTARVAPAAGPSELNRQLAAAPMTGDQATRPADQAAPVAAPRPGARVLTPRAANLALPEVAGKVDRGDLSELASAEPSSMIEQREIDQMFELNQSRLQACFRKGGSPGGSEIILGFIIGASGHMASVWPIASEASVRANQCVLETVNTFQFRATPGGTTQATTTIRYE